MPRIKVECPETGDAVSTAMATDHERFEQESFSGEIQDCPECGGTHAWDDSNAFIE